jgi:hypothetical protein
LFEDIGVAGLVTLAVTYPVVTVGVVAVLVVAATALTIWLWKAVRRVWWSVKARFPGAEF